MKLIVMIGSPKTDELLMLLEIWSDQQGYRIG